MADENTTTKRYGKIKTKDGKTFLVLEPKNMSEHGRRRFGYQPVRFGERDRSKRAKGRKPVQRDGYIEVVWVYA